MSSVSVPQEVLKAYGIEGTQREIIAGGNINRTFKIQGPKGTFALQRLNPIFSPLIHYDIQALTEHLEQRGFCAPRLISTQEEELWVEDDEGLTWRLMTWVSGRSFARAEDPKLCHAAGALFGAFHEALKDFDYVFRTPRRAVHVPSRHLRNLRAALEQHGEHEAFERAAAVAEHIFALEPLFLDFEGLPQHPGHGDPKLNNLVFDPKGQGLALIDLDTIGSMSRECELGDALRSWCNPQGEDQGEAALRVDFFEAALRGYASSAPELLRGCAERIPEAVLTIAAELAARFCADVLNESYFGWDGTRYVHPWQHHLLRAQGQLALARSIEAQLPELRRRLEGLRF